MDSAGRNGGAAAAEAMAAILANIESTQWSHCSAAAATTLFVYDILLTMDLEITHVWKRLRFNLPTVFYFLNRYVSLFFFLSLLYTRSAFRGPLSDTACKIPIFNVGMALGHASWTGVMTLRVAALWRSRPKLVVVIWTCWTLTALSVCMLASASYYYSSSLWVYDPTARLCIMNGTPEQLKPTLIGAYSPIGPTIYETFLTVLTIVKAFDFGQQFSASSIPRLYGVLARDGIVYFMVSIIITVVNLICWFTRPPAEIFLFAFVYWSFLSTVIARLALNLHETRAEGIHVPSAPGAGAFTTHNTFWMATRRQSHQGYGEGTDSMDATGQGKRPRSGMGVMVVKETFASIEGESWNPDLHAKHASFAMQPLKREV